MNIEFGDSELELLIEALGRLHADKVAALASSQKAGLPYAARDFGMPQIEALQTRIEAAYNED
jgi:hypothetical protein